MKAKEFTSSIEASLTRLFDFYVQAAASTSSGVRNDLHFPPTNIREYGGDISKILGSQFARHLEEIESRETNSELSTFLKDNCEKITDNFDILNWWKVNSSKYPVLSQLAKGVLAIPMSTESAFSTSDRVISSFRSSLSPKMVEALICTQSWLRATPKMVDIQDIIQDLQSCEVLEEEFAEWNSGD